MVPAIFLFVIPAITMRLLSEEKKSGTIELLTTKHCTMSRSFWKIPGGVALIGIALLLTLVYYVTIAMLGKIDNGGIGGYCGLMLMAASMLPLDIRLESDGESSHRLHHRICDGFALFMLDKVLIYIPESLASIVEFLGIDYTSPIYSRVIDSRM